MFSVFENEKDYGKSFGEDGILNSTSAMGKESRIGSLYWIVPRRIISYRRDFDRPTLADCVAGRDRPLFL